MHPTPFRLLTSLLVVIALLSVSVGNGLLPLSLPGFLATASTPPPPPDDFNGVVFSGTPGPLIQTAFWRHPRTARRSPGVPAAPLMPGYRRRRRPPTRPEPPAKVVTYIASNMW